LGGAVDGNAVLTPLDSFLIDSKMDDGLPRSGRVIASGNNIAPDDNLNSGPYFDASLTGPAGENSDVCITNQTPMQYNVQNTSRRMNTVDGDAFGSLCTIGVKAGF
jgi:hypothetical protein